MKIIHHFILAIYFFKGLTLASELENSQNFEYLTNLFEWINETLDYLEVFVTQVDAIIHYERNVMKSTKKYYEPTKNVYCVETFKMNHQYQY